MCGIGGELRFDGKPADILAVSRSLEWMRRRGPDAQGLISYGAATLGHRRLKIIDLSDKSRQPLVDSELGLSIVYNGAIYNYPELRAELEAAGYRFFSSGDTEVVLKAFHAWGIGALQRLNGMFAFAVAEQRTGAVTFARDRLGIKPLYYAPIDGGLRFASSLPALVAAGDISGALDPVALHHYLTFHSVVPAPHTLLAGVRKLQAAHFMRVEADGTRKIERYWEPNFDSNEEERRRSFGDWCDLTLESLRRSVERRTIADVPVGVLLSGGLDSSLVVGLLAESGHEHVETFSIGFESVGDEEGDEFRYSDIVAERFGTSHHKIFIDSSRALPALSECIAAMSEPMVSHDNIGFYLLSREVSRHVKVVQSGQGADEIFAGYHWYPPLAEPSAGVADYARLFFDRNHAEMGEILEADWLSEDYSRAFVEGHFAQPGASTCIDRALRIDTQVMLVDDPVKRVDNMTMAWGLEARVPFLDHELVELAARIPARHKIAGGGKHVLKEAARRVIPNEVIDRPKGYFPVPALKYLRGPFLGMVREALLSDSAETRGVLRASYVEALLAEPEAHITPLRGSKLWQLAVLELWLRDLRGRKSPADPDLVASAEGSRG